MFKFLTGIIIALAAVAAFLYFRGIAIYPPVDISFRDSKIPFTAGKVLILVNTSTEDELSGKVKVYSKKDKKELFSKEITLAPEEKAEIGTIGGWSFSTGEKVIVDIEGYIFPKYIAVP